MVSVAADDAFSVVRSAYRADGVVWPLTLCAGDDAAALYDRYRAFQAASVRHRGRETFIKPHLVSTWIDAIVHHPRVLDCVEAAIGSDILLWSSDFFVKVGGKGTYVSWHQDTPFWGLDPLDETVSVWLALTPSTRANGAMRVVPGSHRGGSFGDTRPHPDPQATLDMLRVHQPLAFAFDAERDARFVELEPGEFSIHSGLAVHGGSPNPGAGERVGFVMRYVSTRTRQLAAEDSAMLVRGEDAFGHFVSEMRPDGDFTPRSLAQLEAAMPRPSGFDDMTVK